MSLPSSRALLTLTLALLLAAPLLANDQPKKTDETEEPSPATAETDSTAAVEKMARDALAKFDQGDPGWKVRMEALVGLVKVGPATVPVLVEALKNGSPSPREFAAQVLVVFAGPAARLALLQALDDPEASVHIYVVKALNMLGRLELTNPQRERLKAGAPYWMREYIDFVSERDDTPNPGAMRKALRDYDLAKMDSAGLGQVAPEFALSDGSGAVHRLSQFRGKKVVILEFNDGEG